MTSLPLLGGAVSAGGAASHAPSQKRELRTAAQFASGIESDDAARRFLERFEALSRDMRVSLHREKNLLDECRLLCEGALSQTRGLETAMQHTASDASEMTALRARLIDAEQETEEARLRESLARSAVAKGEGEIAHWRAQLAESAAQAARLRNVVTQQAQKEKLKVTLKKLGSGPSPFEDWKAATGRQIASVASGKDAPRGLSPGALRRLGHVPPAELDGIREAVRESVLRATGGGDTLDGGGASGGGGGGGGSSRAAARSSPPRQHHHASLLEVVPHPLFPAHLYRGASDGGGDEPLDGAAPPLSVILALRGGEGGGGLDVDPALSASIDLLTSARGRGGVGGGGDGSEEGAGGESARALAELSSPESAAEESLDRSNVRKLFARIDARAAKIAAIKEASILSATLDAWKPRTAHAPKPAEVDLDE